MKQLAFLILGVAISTMAFAQEGLDSMSKKLRSIVFPQVVFSNASIDEAIEFVRMKSRDLDTSESNRGLRGINIVLIKGRTNPMPLSLDLRNVPLEQLLRFCADLSDLKMKVEPRAVILAPELVAPAETKGLSGGELVFPSIQFAGASLAEAIEFIRAKSRDLDPAKQGVNVLIKSGAGNTSKITMALTEIKVVDALRYIAQSADASWSVDGGVFVIASKKQ